MASFTEKMRERARKLQKRLVLPEGLDLRILQAGRILLDEGLVRELVVLGAEAEVRALARQNAVDISGIQVLDPQVLDPSGAVNFDAYAAEFYELRKKKGISEADARKAMQDPLHFAAMMVRQGASDALVAGAENSTANVLRAGFTIIKTAPGVKIAASCFVMDFSAQPDIMNGRQWGADGLMIFADCATIPNPSAEELADITLQSAESCRVFLDVEPVVAMLSFSTKGSARHENVDKVLQALELVQAKAPQLKVDGELQLDAAMVAAVGEKKAPGSTVAGKANVLIFPDLQSGNIGYKLVQRFAQAEAYGPFLQGFALPISDLSRGCSVEDIVNTAAVTMTQ